jgi:hypothetical protein
MCPAALLPYFAGRSDCARLQRLRPRFYHYPIELYTAVVMTVVMTVAEPVVMKVVTGYRVRNTRILFVLRHVGICPRGF